MSMRPVKTQATQKICSEGNEQTQGKGPSENGNPLHGQCKVAGSLEKPFSNHDECGLNANQQDFTKNSITGKMK